MKHFKITIKKLIPILVVTGCITAVYLFTVRIENLQSYTVLSSLVDMKKVKSNAVIPLNGVWRFDDRLITSYHEATKTVLVPHIWDNRNQGRYGSYALRILPKKINNGGYALYFNRIGSAYRVFINGTLRLENGTVGTDITSSVPHRAVRVLTFDHHSLQPVDIVIQVSNFHHPTGGLKSSVLFGTQQEIIRHLLLFKIMDILCIGGMLVIAFCHLFIFVYRSTDKEHLFISLFVLMLGFYIAGSGESMITLFIPNFNYDLCLRLLHISLALPLFLYNRFYTYLFPQQEIRALSIFVEVMAILYTLFIIITPVKTFTEYLFIIHGLLVVVILYRNIGLIVGIVRGNPEAFTVMLGNAAFSVASFIELAYVNQIATNSRVMPMGLLMLAISYNVVILERYLDKVKTLSKAERTVIDITQKNKIVKTQLTIHESLLNDLKQCVTHPNFTADIARIERALEKIAYFKAENGLSVAYGHAENELFDIALSLTTIVNMFDKNLCFVRCHRSYIVNPRLIEHVVKTGSDKKILILTSGIRVPAGPKYLEELKLFLSPNTVTPLKAV